MGLKGCVVKLSPEQEKLHHRTVMVEFQWMRRKAPVMGKPVLDLTQYVPRYTRNLESINQHLRGWKVVKMRPGRKHQWAVLYPSANPRWKHRVLRNSANRRRFFATPADAIVAADKAARRAAAHAIAALVKGARATSYKGTAIHSQQ